MGNDKKGDKAPKARFEESDRSVAEPVASIATDRLTFDGLKLRWAGSASIAWNAFSGPADESLKESKKGTDDVQGGPIPQGLFAIDPAKIKVMAEVDWDDWGKQRVICEALVPTKTRMKDCFDEGLRAGFYVHGGTSNGTNGCIELNNDADALAFFTRLAAYKAKIELEVKYVGDKKTLYEESKCPY